MKKKNRKMSRIICLNREFLRLKKKKELCFNIEQNILSLLNSYMKSSYMQ